MPVRLAIVMLFFAATAYAGECFKLLEVSKSGLVVPFGDCKPAGTSAVITIARTAREFPIRTISDTLHLIVLNIEVSETLIEQLRRQATVSIAIGDIKERAPILVRGFPKTRAYEVAIGPVSIKDQNAMRFRGNYWYEYRKGEISGPAARGEINLDTTDSGDRFLDDNFVSLSGGYSGMRWREAVRRGFAGARVRYTKAFHSGNDDLDVMATLSGNIPLVQAFTIGGGPFAAPPLAIDLNAGYRDATHGRFFEGTLTHHLFLGGRYWLAASGTWTVDDHTRRLYRLAISQFDDRDSHVTLMTTLEDGSARAVLKKVRQYFIGLGWEIRLR